MKRQHDECRAWLESYRELKTEAYRLEQRHMRLMTQATRITSRWSAVPGGGERDGEKLLAALADSDDEAVRGYHKAKERMREIEEFIDSLPTQNSRIILRLRYVELYRWQEIERILPRSHIYYSMQHIYDLHGAALTEARREWNKRKEKDNARP